MTERSAGTGYAIFQLHRALRAANEHSDASVRQHAAKRSEQWEQVIRNMHTGIVRVGSRVPVKDTAAWFTLDVVTGGFATGGLAAGGDLLPFETRLSQQVGGDSVSKLGTYEVRQLLNYYFITDNGFQTLIDSAESGCYEVTVPEEGALLVAAWLATNDRKEESVTLIEQLEPHFAKVRFYPQPADTPRKTGDNVFLRDVKSVSADLTKINTPHNIRAQKEAITAWEPLRDSIFAFLFSNIDGDPPELTNEHGTPEMLIGGVPQLSGDAHVAAAQEFVDQFENLRKQNRLCNKPVRKNTLAQAVAILKTFALAGQLTDQQAKRLALLCARHAAKRGVPGSEQLDRYRNAQSQQIDGALFVDIAKVVLNRLSKLDEKQGVEEFDSVIANVSDSESTAQVTAGESIPPSLMRKLERCMMDSVQTLVERKVIKSGDSLAIVLPQVTGSIRASGLSCPHLRNLHASIYRAFRQRRSLLLLDYESQVRIEELPWVAMIDGLRESKLSEKGAALAAAREIASLTFTNFPTAIVPNKLLQEFRAVTHSAGQSIPLVDELAADIFMGSFTNKFVEAAKIAGQLLGGSVYESYYQIDYDEIQAIPVAKSRQRKRGFFGIAMPAVSDAFAAICARRAIKGNGSISSFVAKNGTIIEQQQVLTTQNLAPLLVGLNLVDDIRLRSIELAQHCFQHVCDQLQIKDENFHARLIKLKNSAYTWRQMLVFLSIASADEIRGFSAWVDETMQLQSQDFQTRFTIATNGLRSAIAANQHGTKMPQNHQPFLGWSLGDHWFLKPPNAEHRS